MKSDVATPTAAAIVAKRGSFRRRTNAIGVTSIRPRDELFDLEALVVC